MERGPLRSGAQCSCIGCIGLKANLRWGGVAAHDSLFVLLRRVILHSCTARHGNSWTQYNKQRIVRGYSWQLLSRLALRPAMQPREMSKWTRTLFAKLQNFNSFAASHGKVKIVLSFRWRLGSKLETEDLTKWLWRDRDSLGVSRHEICRFKADTRPFFEWPGGILLFFVVRAVLSIHCYRPH